VLLDEVHVPTEATFPGEEINRVLSMDFFLIDKEPVNVVLFASLEQAMLDKQHAHRVLVHVFNVVEVSLAQFVCSSETSLLPFLLFLDCLLCLHLFHLDFARA